MAALALLIADDEPLGAMALRSQLEALGHHVAAHARDGAHAIDLARCFLVDMAILDFRMPAMTGLEAATRIFHNRPIPILVLSGFPEEDDGAPRPPTYHYIVKPADVDEIQQGMTTARDRFQDWLRNADNDRLRRLQDDARLVDQARQTLARNHGCSQRTACQKLLDDARRFDLPLPDIARQILNG